MDSILALADPQPPATLDGSVAALAQRFLREPGLDMVAVLDGERPVGVVSRSAILAVANTPLREWRITQVMDAHPLVVDGASDLAALRQRLGQTPGQPGAVILADGDYVGVLSLRRLLDAAHADLAQRRPPLHRDPFLEALSHEARTALNGILAMADLLQRQPLSADSRTYVQTLADSSRNLLGTVSDALDLSRGEAGKLDLAPQPTNLRELMDAVQATWTGRGRDGVSLLVSYDGDDLAALIDADRLRQVFDHLIDHSLRLTRHGAVEASLRARRLQHGVLIEGWVRDTGSGYAPERLARIFETSAEPGGLGLTLPLCRRVIDAMHGTIRAESNVGAGATISFDLIAEEAAPEEQAAAQPGDGDAPRTAHVLVVDDNATNRMVAEALCEMFDCTSECAEDGVEAVEAARSGRFDLILMDIKMPRMDGVEATRAIRALPGPAAQTPIIALTANADPDDARAYLSAGMNAVVEKPIKPERLLAAMNELLPPVLADGEAAAA